MKDVSRWLRAEPERFPKLVGLLSMFGLVQTVFYRVVEGVWVETPSLVVVAVLAALAFGRGENL